VRLRVFHTTRYSYPTPVAATHNEVRLMPLSDEDQICLDFRLSTSPPAHLFAYDLASGRVHHFDLQMPHSELTIHAESLVVTHRHDPFAGLPLTGEDDEFYTREAVRQNYAEYLAPTFRVQLHPETDRIASVARRQGSVGTASFLIALTRLLNRVLAYIPGSTNVNSTIQQVLEQKQGVCQDFAHLMLAICRRQGIPARYVSGYLYTGERPLTPAGSQSTVADSEAGESAASETSPPEGSGGLVSGDAMHAWIECLLPDNRWYGFDPTNNLLTNDAYIKVHYGRDYGDVPPVRGVYRGPFAHTLEVSVRVVADTP
jgi:transglutaminase-like putative cysteine protease